MTVCIHRLVAALFGAALSLAVAAAPAAGEEPAIAAAIAQHLEGLDSGLIVNAASRRIADLQEFYRQRGNRPVWVADGAPTKAAETLREALAAAEREGLDPDDYDAGEFSPHEPRSVARYDIAQSAAALRYISDLHSGRAAPSQIEPDLFVKPRPTDSLRTLNEIVASADIAAYLERFVPTNARYHDLRDKLAETRKLAAEGGWPLPGPGPVLKPGQRGPEIAAVRARLRSTDPELSPAADEQSFDDALRDAVMRFQQRNGLESDGIVGPKTREALNRTPEARIRQIVVNMERWRWMPDDLGRRYVVVNIAGFELDAVADGLVRQNMRVIVGRTYRRTPVFTGRMTYLEINPYWHVPPSIAVKDLLPKIRNSAAYLGEDGFRVFDGWGANAREVDPARIDWAALGPKYFPYKLRQDPGPKNALGQVKFMFPNEHNVYLHDTSARNLFSRTVRDFSSGCIRIERPLDLAQFVLEGQADWPPAAIAAAFGSSESRKIVIADPLPVHITYQTAWVDIEGHLQLRDDIYERDAALAAILFARADAAAAAVR